MLQNENKAIDNVNDFLVPIAMMDDFCELLCRVNHYLIYQECGGLWIAFVQTQESSLQHACHTFARQHGRDGHLNKIC